MIFLPLYNIYVILYCIMLFKMSIVFMFDYKCAFN